MNKIGFVENIQRKLIDNTPLNPNEIHAIICALRESKNCLQEPYYEVIYHDQYDNTETRVMEPIYSRTIDSAAGCRVQEDHFDLNFRRIVRRECDYED